jgi:hypothetical protein
MQLYRATALIALVMILLLSAGYAAGEHDQPEQASSLSAPASGS